MPIRSTRAPARRRTLVVTALLGVLANPANGQVSMGSPLVDRAFDDTALGVACVYRGATQPLTGKGIVGSWFMYDADSLGLTVTPLLIEVLGPNRYRVVAFGTSRASTGQGVQSWPFEPIAGDALYHGSYTFGVSHRAYASVDGVLVPSAAGLGAVDFDCCGLTDDAWSYVSPGAEVPPDLALGTILGDGGIPLDSRGGAGRIYSAQLRACLAITQAPANRSACAGSTQLLSVIASGEPAPAYSWRRNGIAINPKINPSAATPSLAIEDFGPSDEGAYDCVVTNGCGSVSTDPAVLAICASDFNCDGVVNSTDVSDFINAWFTDLAEGSLVTDRDANGVVNSTDVSDFINDWFEDTANGCG